MLMERNLEIIRGWPSEGALERAETIKTGSTLNNGDVVAKQSDGTVDKVGTTAANQVGFVFVGNGDSAAAANTNKAVVLWGNFIARTSNYAAGAYVPGANLTAKNGQIALATAPNMSATPPSLGDPVIGYVLNVTAASSTETAHITFVVN
jgi:hypothetical protein